MYASQQSYQVIEITQVDRVGADKPIEGCGFDIGNTVNKNYYLLVMLTKLPS
jgi:hypothetical protein